MKLSEKLWAWDADETDEFAHEARALEERVAKCEEFEAMAARVHKAVKDERDAANARAEAAERDSDHWRAENTALKARIAEAMSRAETARLVGSMYAMTDYEQGAHDLAERIQAAFAPEGEEP